MSICDQDSLSSSDYDSHHMLKHHNNNMDHVKKKMQQLLCINKDLQSAITESRFHIQSLYMLTSLMLISVVSIHSYFTFYVPPTPSSPPIDTNIPPYYSNTVQGQIAKIVTDKYELNDYFYETLTKRIKQIFFDAKLIKSDFIMHDELADSNILKFGNIGVNLGLAAMPLARIMYAFAEAGIRQYANLHLDEMATHTLRLKVFAPDEFPKRFASYFLYIDNIKDEINSIEEQYIHAKRRLLPFMGNKKSKEEDTLVTAVKLVDELAIEYAQNIGKMIGTGFCQKVWKHILSAFGTKDPHKAFEGMSIFASNHPIKKARLSHIFGKDSETQHQNEEKATRIYVWLSTNEKWLTQNQKSLALNHDDSVVQKRWREVWKSVLRYYQNFGDEQFMNILGQDFINWKKIVNA